ncbi:unnamed protein product [Parnassius mnemosyne]|uniref:Fatty acid desaturase domain-containing protein n=1 Tax=Parnassius mnemosyne TaxID=213953 RepID=A0AAV1KQW9_9NEOP
MAPTTKQEFLNAEDDFDRSVSRAAPRKYDIIYLNILKHIFLHLCAVYGMYLMFTEAQWKTVIFNVFYFHAGALGITIGAHRLWTHKAFKAKLPLEILLMLFNSIAFQSTAFQWIRDHRLHHKYSDTDADPYNASRGFFFSHIGWLLVRKHPKVIEKGKTIDMSDINNNPVLKFQSKYAIPVIGMCCYIIPTLTPVYLWNESFTNAFYINILRHIVGLHIAFSVNSFTHLWGKKPYDKNIKSTQSIIVSLLSGGEGYHNYHHVFPWDYRTAEIGNNWINTSTLVIDLLAKIGLAYDLKTTPESMVLERLKRTGDGSNLWGVVGKF